MKHLITALVCIIIGTSCQTKRENETVVKSPEHAAHKDELFTKTTVEIKTIGIFLYNGYSTLDAIGPYSVLNHLMGTHVFFVAKHKGFIADGAGMKVEVDTSMDEVKHLDVLLIPGGLKETYQQTEDTAVLNWIRSIDRTSTYTTSVCTGAWILGAAGLLRNKEATTHWYGKKTLADDYGVKVQNLRYTHSGKYWTSAGVSAGIDMSLALINEIRGEKYTRMTMLDMEYDPQPPFKGGSESNTDKELVKAVRLSYDGSMDAALHPEKTFKNMKFDNAKDLVCGMPITTGVMDTAHYKGKTFAFCSAECKKEFRSNPTAFFAAK